MAQKVLMERNFKMFTPREFEHIFEVSSHAAHKFIHEHTKKGFFTKLRSSLYTFTDSHPPLFVIANRIYRPSYISLETALSVYGIIPETVYTVTSITARTSREFSALNVVFSYTRIKQSAYQGYIPKKERDQVYFIAEPEKAFADYLYFVSLGKKTLHDRFSIRNLDKQKVRAYGEFFKRRGLMELIENVWNNTTSEYPIY